MGLVILVIVFIVGAEWQKHHGISHPRQESFDGEIGRDDYSQCVITQCDVVNLVNSVPITEAAYHQDPSVQYHPAFGAVCTHGEQLII